MDQVLLGKIALVTGAARGIGRATALAFAHAGADVIGADIAGPVSAALEVRPSSPDDLAETGTAVREAGRRWLGLRFDQRDIASIRAMAPESALLSADSTSCLRMRACRDSSHCWK